MAIFDEKKRGILLVNLGTPDSYEPSAVYRYLKEFLKDKDCIFDDPILYTTKIEFDLKKRPSLSDVDEVMFTSPSTVDGFMAAYKGEVIPKSLILKPIGPVTQKKIEELF